MSEVFYMHNRLYDTFLINRMKPIYRYARNSVL